MTLFNYNTNVPLGTDNPSTSQGQFLTNFNSIAGIVNEDMIGFGLNNGGFHKKITLPNFNPPPTVAVPTNPPVLFANIQDGAGNALPAGVPELFFYSGSAAQGQSQYVAASSGSVLLLGGIIIKWGSLNPTTLAPPSTVVYVNPFPNNVFSVVITVANFQYGTTAQNYRAVIPGTVGGFSFFSTGLTVANPINYIAIGN